MMSYGSYLCIRTGGAHPLPKANTAARILYDPKATLTLAGHIEAKQRWKYAECVRKR
jgi:hypothetical protein